MADVKVRNVIGTADNKCTPCGTWLKHWEKHFGGTTSYCWVSGCTNSVEVGGHVKKVSGGNTWHIVPLCHKCNMRTDEFDVPEGRLVSAQACSS
jgi:hypothetical protein